MPTGHDSITQAFIIAWDNAIQHEAQQTVSRLMSTVMDKGSITGESFTHNRMGSTELDEKTTRLADTEWGNIEHATVVANMRDFYKALPLDRADIPKMLVNPVAGGDYMSTLMAARNRKCDDIIYQALLGTATYKDGSTEALPATQKILGSSQGFTKAKVIQARKMFRANELDHHTGETLYMLYDDAMLEDILADTTLTSAEFLAGQALQNGDLASSWMGFNWIPYNPVNVAGTVRSTVAYTKSAAKFGRGYEEGNVTRRGDKQDAWQVSMAASYGCLRTEAARVVQIDFEQ